MIRLLAIPAFGALAFLASPGLPGAVPTGPGPVVRVAITPAPLTLRPTVRVPIGLDRLALTGGASPAPPFVLIANAIERNRATQCLAEAVYYEAGFEPEIGKRAVAQVVVNRVRDRQFPATVCGVVYQGASSSGDSGKRGCQFSFACDGSLVRRPPRDAEWTSAWQVAVDALSGHVVGELGAATHYHALYVRPGWANTLTEVAGIGAHRFYRWPGRRGLPDALQDQYRGGEPPPLS